MTDTDIMWLFKTIATSSRGVVYQPAGTGCDQARTGVESCQDDSYQDDNMAEGKDSGMAIAKGCSMVAAPTEGHTALGIGVKQVGFPVTNLTITLLRCNLYIAGRLSSGRLFNDPSRLQSLG